MSQVSVHAIFPIPVYVVDCDDNFIESIDFLKKDHDLVPNEFSTTYGNKTIDDYILENVECQSLKNCIIKHIENFADKILAWDFENFQLTQSWVTIKNPNEKHDIHHHPNSVLSGVFYFDDVHPVEPLIFHRPAVMSHMMTQFAPNTSTEKMKSTEFPWNEYLIEPKINRLVIFPSWLGHSVSINKSNIPRKSLAFNAVPTGKFGHQSSATEFDFSRLS
jgi:uncharacterized protein (TIGR02466 family)